MADAPAGLVAAINKLNPFVSKKTHETEHDDVGEATDAGTIAGGGHSAKSTAITRGKLRVSDALKAFLLHEGILPAKGSSEEEWDAQLRRLVDKPHIDVPASVVDRSHPLPEYYVSSSHNTYLIANQLYGSSSASAYEKALDTGARCVEIDAWDNPENADEPKVTHGYTLVSNIPFRAVCETIRDVVDREAAAADAENLPAAARPGPVLLSLENHCGAHGQQRLVASMQEVWGDRLLARPLEVEGSGGISAAADDGDATAQHVRLDQLGSKILLIVEYHVPAELDDSDDSGTSSSESDDSEPDEARAARRAYRESKRKAPADAAAIVPELAALGVYAQSVKPADNSWYDPGILKNGPHHHLINLSEVGLGGHMPQQNAPIARHNARHLMRVFPKGTRITSANLKPVPFWALGAQICALNWQTFSASMQLNEALFSGTAGYVLKPAALRAGGSGVLSRGVQRRLRLHVAGATDVPAPAGRKADDIRPYVTCMLIHPDGTTASGDKGPKRKTDAYKPKMLHFFGDAGPPATEPVWDETLEWTFDDNELVFLRILIKSDDAFETNPVLAVTCVRLLYVVGGWSFIRLLDLKGRETTCSLLVRFDLEDVD